MSGPIVRYAPSPTGDPHIGNTRTALFNWLFARRHGGKFLIRVEDTDRVRSEERWTQRILEGLKWLGLDWDDEPVFQSQRMGLYLQALERLKPSRHVYRCFCTEARLTELREKSIAAKRAYIYDNHCLTISDEESQRRADAGEAHSWRFHVGPGEGLSAFHDIVRGHVKVDRALLGDFIVARSDGNPVFNFANVVDDIDLGITHVIRGDDHLSNTSRQILIYNALGATTPQFAHLPMILGGDKQKLSKRHGAVSVLLYRDEGYMPEAISNFLALLGWSLDDKTVVLSKELMVENFALERVNKSGAVYDIDKLKWLNGQHFRALGETECVRRVREWMGRFGPDPGKFDAEWLDAVIKLEIERAENIEGLVKSLDFFLSDEFPYEEKDVEKVLRKEGIGARLVELADALEGAADFKEATLEPMMRALAEKQGIGFGKLAQPCRVAVTGRAASPPLFDVLHWLGKQRVVKRLRHAAATLCEVA